MINLKINKEQLIQYFSFISHFDEFNEQKNQDWLWEKYKEISYNIKNFDNFSFIDLSNLLKNNQENHLSLILISKLDFFNKYIPKKKSFIFDISILINIIIPFIISFIVLYSFSPILFYISLIVSFIVFNIINKHSLKIINKLFIFKEKQGAKNLVNKINNKEINSISLKDLLNKINNFNNQIDENNKNEIQEITKKSIFILKFLEQEQNNYIDIENQNKLIINFSKELDKIWTTTLPLFLKIKNNKERKSNFDIISGVLTTYIEEIYFLQEEKITKEKIYWAHKLI